MKHHFNLCYGEPRADSSQTGVYTVTLGKSDEVGVSCHYETVFTARKELRAFGAWLIAIADGTAAPLSYAIDSDVFLP